MWRNLILCKYLSEGEGDIFKINDDDYELLVFYLLNIESAVAWNYS